MFPLLIIITPLEAVAAAAVTYVASMILDRMLDD